MSDRLPDRVDVVIVGAGPAGLAAAAALAGWRVLVLDREGEAGGIPRHCAHSPYGLREFRRLMTGPAYARALVDRARDAGAWIAAPATVTALHPGPRVTVTTPAGVQEITARAVLLATGVRESSRAQRLIGGEKPGGIIPTGALQGLVHLSGQRPFRRPVILGTELVSFSALLTCRSAGIRPVAMVEPNPRPTVRRPLHLFAALRGVPLHLSTTIAAIEGRDRVSGVVLRGPSGERRVAADGVILTGAFRAEGALLPGSHLTRDPGTGGPAVDAWGRCSDPAFFAAGNLLHPVETAGHCWEEGRAVGQSVARALEGGLPDPVGERIAVSGGALAYVVPQTAGTGGAFDRLNIRVRRPVRGRLSLRVAGAEVASRAIHALPERRITLPMPPAGGPVELVLLEDE